MQRVGLRWAGMLHGMVLVRSCRTWGGASRRLMRWVMGACGWHLFNPRTFWWVAARCLCPRNCACVWMLGKAPPIPAARGGGLEWPGPLSWVAEQIERGGGGSSGCRIQRTTDASHGMAAVERWLPGRG